MSVVDDVLWDENGNVRPLRAVDGPLPALWVETASWVEEGLPRRPWVAKGYLLRGAVSVLAGPGAAGKSMLCLGYAVALAFGQQWGKFLPILECKVSLLNAEDDADEQKLRLSAVLRSFGRVPDDLAGKVARLGFSRNVHLIDYDPSTGIATPTAAFAELDAHLGAFKSDVVTIDPLVELHNANENDNQALRAVVACFRELSRKHNCAILIVHHSRKGSGDAHGDMDMIRGAGAIVGAARVALTCCVMTETEARDLGIPPESKGFYFRVDGAKSNYAPIREAEWYERVEHTLDNEETVSAAVPWEPTRQQYSADELAGIVDRIGRAMPPYSPRLSEREDRSVAHLLTAMGFTTRAAQEGVLAALEKNCGVLKARIKKPGKGKNDFYIGLRTREGEPSAAAWLD